MITKWVLFINLFYFYVIDNASITCLFLLVFNMFSLLLPFNDRAGKVWDDSFIWSTILNCHNKNVSKTLYLITASKHFSLVKYIFNLTKITQKKYMFFSFV